MLLTDTIRQKIWTDYMSQISSDRQKVTLSKTELRAAVDAVDDWVDANAAAFNSALPAAAQSGLTARQKAALLMYVVQKRTEVV